MLFFSSRELEGGQTCEVRAVDAPKCSDSRTGHSDVQEFNQSATDLSERRFLAVQCSLGKRVFEVLLERLVDPNSVRSTTSINMGRPTDLGRHSAQEPDTALAISKERGRRTWTEFFWETLSAFWHRLRGRRPQTVAPARGNRGIIKRAKHERHIKYRIYSKSTAASARGTPIGTPLRLGTVDPLASPSEALGASLSSSSATERKLPANFEQWSESVKQEILLKLRSEFDGHLESLRASAVSSPNPRGMSSNGTGDDDMDFSSLPSSAPPPAPPLPPMGISMPPRTERETNGTRATDTVGTWVYC